MTQKNPGRGSSWHGGGSTSYPRGSTPGARPCVLPLAQAVGVRLPAYLVRSGLWELLPPGSRPPSGGGYPGVVAGACIAPLLPAGTLPLCRFIAAEVMDKADYAEDLRLEMQCAPQYLWSLPAEVDPPDRSHIPLPPLVHQPLGSHTVFVPILLLLVMWRHPRAGGRTVQPVGGVTVVPVHTGPTGTGVYFVSRRGRGQT